MKAEDGTDCGRLGRPHHRRAWVVLVGLGLVVALIPLGCGETTRYRVLSFFFDGVPSPEERAAAGSVENDEGERSDTPAVLSVHRPVEEGQCAKCHGMPTSPVPLEQTKGELCRRCHSTHFTFERTDWVHTPAATECSYCHHPHESQHRALLTDSQPGLCLGCHGAAVLERPYHADIGERACSTCHDPHFAGNRLLLADSRTYSRSQLARQATGSVHEPWKEHACDVCHLVKQSNALIEDVDAACRSCHEDVLVTATAAPNHSPVREGKCLLCHQPHQSFKPHLLRLTGEAMCISCHEVESISRDDHPGVHRVDCLLCHRGHSSPRGALLKPGIPSRRWPETMPSEPGPRDRDRAEPASSPPAGDDT